MGKQKRVKFDIGCTYQNKNSEIFIAISDTALVTLDNSKVVIRKPRTTYCLSDITVEQICKRWKISIDYLDTIMGEYLTPPKVRPKKCPRIVKDPDAYYRLRLVRLSA